MIIIKDIKNGDTVELRELDYIPSTGEVMCLEHINGTKINGIVQSVEHRIIRTHINTQNDLIINVY